MKNGKDLKEYIKSNRINKMGLAAKLGVSRTALYEWLNNDKFLDLIAKQLGLTIDSNNTNSGNTITGDMNKSQIANSTIHDHSGVSENLLTKMLESQEDTIKWLKQKLDEKDLSITMLREMLSAKEKQIERFEQKSGDNIIELFNKLNEILTYIDTHHKKCAENHGLSVASLKEHKDKTWKDLDTIKRDCSKSKKKRIVR